MDSSRLLSSAQLEDCIYTKPGSNLSTAQRIALAQDAQTATQVEAATLRKVGEWLNRIGEPGLPDSQITEEDIDALRAGKMPKGWGK